MNTDFYDVRDSLRRLLLAAMCCLVGSFGSLLAEGSFDEVLNNKKVQEAYLGT